jgi:hypothetical protein
MVDCIPDGWVGLARRDCRRILESPSHFEHADANNVGVGKTAAGEPGRRDFLTCRGLVESDGRVFSTIIGNFSTALWLRIAGIQSMFMTGRKELRKPIEISTAEFVVQQNRTA